MRRYCIMYYQQSYVLIFSHEMALFPFTYHLKFNYVNDLTILRSVRFQGPVLLLTQTIRIPNADFSFYYDTYSTACAKSVTIVINNIVSISILSRLENCVPSLYARLMIIRRHDLAKPSISPFTYQA